MPKILGLLLVFGILLAASSAHAQSFVTGVTQEFCASRGGQFTYTGTAGTSAQNIGECYIPSSLPQGAAPGGLGGARSGGAANTMGAAGGLIGSMLRLGDQLDDLQNSGGGQSGLKAPSNADALSLEDYDVVLLPAEDPALDALAHGDDHVRTYAMLGVLGDPYVALDIGKACADSTQTAQMACIIGKMTDVLLEKLPGAYEQCGKELQIDQSICVTLMQMQQTGIQPGQCIGNCNFPLQPPNPG